VEPEAPAADANSLLHRLAAGGRLSPEGLTDGPCVSLTRPVQEYLKKAGGMAGEYRAMVIAAFNRDNYSAYCRKQPAAEEKRAPTAGVPAEHTLDYFLLRRSWLKGREKDAAMHLILDVDRDEVFTGGGAVRRQAKPDRGVGLRAGAPAPQDLSVGVERGRV